MNRMDVFEETENKENQEKSWTFRTLIINGLLGLM